MVDENPISENIESLTGPEEYDQMPTKKRLSFGRVLTGYLLRNISKIKAIKSAYNQAGENIDLAQAADLLLQEPDPEHRRKINRDLEHKIHVEKWKKFSGGDEEKAMKIGPWLSSYIKPRLAQMMRYILNEQHDAYEIILERMDNGNSPGWRQKHRGLVQRIRASIRQNKAYGFQYNRP